MKQYDAIIIGFGKAGKTLAAELSNRGWQVAVVEQSDEMYGGACPNVACIPTKTLIHESEISTLLYHNDFDKQSNMYRQAIARKNKLTSFLRENNYEKLSKRPNVTIYTGKGSLVSANTVKVALPEEEIELQGKEIFINTGSTPIIPNIEGIQQSRLSGARCTHDGDKLAFTDGERDAAQGMHGFVPHLEVAFDILKFNDCFIHNSFLCIIFRSSSYFPEGQA